jgi:predicted neuraminidase
MAENKEKFRAFVQSCVLPCSVCGQNLARNKNGEWLCVTCIEHDIMRLMANLTNAIRFLHTCKCCARVMLQDKIGDWICYHCSASNQSVWKCKEEHSAPKMEVFGSERVLSVSKL